MYELMQHEDLCNAACMDAGGMEIRYPQCSQFGGSQTCSCAKPSHWGAAFVAC